MCMYKYICVHTHCIYIFFSVKDEFLAKGEVQIASALKGSTLTVQLTAPLLKSTRTEAASAARIGTL